uniref:Dipeptidyl peptidase 1 n=1 Tax=Strigamia maritima TaxID=126957 RepID=T1IR55_STRMM
MAAFFCLLAGLIVVVPSSVADTPANCTYDDIQGNWIFYETERSRSTNENCDKIGSVVYKTQLKLKFPNLVVDDLGNIGFWTIIYNQGFEVVINQRKYFAFSLFKQSGQNATNYCDQTFPGWSHDILVRNWACFMGKKVGLWPEKYISLSKSQVNGMYRTNKGFINEINNKQTLWTAKVYSHFEKLSHEELLSMRGGRKSKIIHLPKSSPISREIEKLTSNLPLVFDWRNVSGVNYISPIRNQGTCGSCYSFASMAMLEARLRIYTNNTNQVIFAPQDVVSCSEYSQGCEGGFPYLIAGKYAQDFGVIPENCYPYSGRDEKCSGKKCTRTYVSKYSYVGGFYGGCNEALMRYAIVHNGPVAVGFQVYPDFMQYSSGIYHHSGVLEKFNPFELTNHAVLVVGYGEENGVLFWIVKNSWGTGWGENGFFRIRRGNDECSIESLGMEAVPIP